MAEVFVEQPLALPGSAKNLEKVIYFFQYSLSELTVVEAACPGALSLHVKGMQIANWILRLQSILHTQYCI